MKVRSLVGVVMALALACAAAAQTKQSGTAQCGKPDPTHSVEIGDRPNHSMVMSKFQCTWTKGLEMGGSSSKDGNNTEIAEMSGSKSTGSGVHWSTMASGDKYFVKYSVKGSYTKDGALESGSGTWKYTGGTGKLKGLTGNGTFTCKGNADGSATCEVEGEYTLPAAK
ncbi:MAG: hypothetical protein ACRD1P_13945 [Thermoanaerobaculia bacterium]